MSRCLKKGDLVIVLSGKSKNKKGRIIEFDHKKNRVFVSGLQYIKKAEKPSQSNQEGGIVEKESSIHYSNLMLYSEKLGRGVRVSKIREGKNVFRVSKKTGERF